MNTIEMKMIAIAQRYFANIKILIVNQNYNFYLLANEPKVKLDDKFYTIPEIIELRKQYDFEAVLKYIPNDVLYKQEIRTKLDLLEFANLIELDTEEYFALSTMLEFNPYMIRYTINEFGKILIYDIKCLKEPVVRKVKVEKVPTKKKVFLVNIKQYEQKVLGLH